MYNVLIAALLAFLSPPRGVLVATRAADVVYVTRIAGDVITEERHEPSPDLIALGWLDHDTLVTYRETDDGRGTVTWLTTGKPAVLVAVPAAPAPADRDREAAELVFGRHGEVFLRRQRAALVVAPTGAITAAAAPSAKLTLAGRVRRATAWDGQLLTGAPTVAAPPGFAVALFDVPRADRKNYMVSYTRGYRCTSPTGKTEWPYGIIGPDRLNIPEFRPSSVRWVTTSPPRYVVEGVGMNMVSEHYPLALLYRACDDAAITGAVLPDGLFGQGPASDQDPAPRWTLSRGDHAIGTLPGDTSLFVVQP